MTIEPLGDRLIVRPEEPKDVTEGGLYIPANAKEPPQTGEVVAIGTGPWDDAPAIPERVKVGDRILFGRYAGAEVVIEGERYLILRGGDVMGLVVSEQEETTQ